jgi:putative NADH-flavin reductase
VKLAVFGATGGTGQQVVAQALARGHQVTAVVRRPEAFTVEHEQQRVVAGDVARPDSLDGVLDATGAVISALGVGTQKGATTVYSAGTANIVSAMRSANISRLVAVSASPAGPWREAGLVNRFAVYPILQRLFGASYDDMRRMEEFLAGSGTEWTVVRPPRLLDNPAKGDYRIATTGPVPGGRSITRADLATAILDALDNESLIGHAVSVAN